MSGDSTAKEAYFTAANIDGQALRMRDSLQSFRVRHSGQAFRRESAALLVLDMQAYFLNPRSHAFVPSATAIIPNLQQLIQTFRHLSRPVLFTRHLNTPADAGQMSRWWKDLIEERSAQSHIIPELEASAETLIRKSQYDAFHESMLQDRLRLDGIQQVVVTGVLTHLCCETAAPRSHAATRSSSQSTQPPPTPTRSTQARC
jgi:isochorismate hydrolase